MTSRTFQRTMNVRNTCTLQCTTYGHQWQKTPGRLITEVQKPQEKFTSKTVRANKASIGGLVAPLSNVAQFCARSHYSHANKIRSESGAAMNFGAIFAAQWTINGDIKLHRNQRCCRLSNLLASTKVRGWRKISGLCWAATPLTKSANSSAMGLARFH